MSDPRQHHYVPRWLQRQFSAPEGQLYVGRRSSHNEHKFFQTKGEKIFSQKDLYAVEGIDGRKKFALETDLYSPLDSDAASLHRWMSEYLVRGLIPALSYSARQLLWSFFVYHAHRRHPDSYNDYERYANRAAIAMQTASEITSNLADQIRIASSLEKIEFSETEIKNAKNEARSTISKGMFNHITSFSVQFGCVINETDSFILPDQPIFDAQNDAEVYNRTGSRLWIPISSTIAIAPNGTDQIDKIVRLSATQVRTINKFVTRGSKIVAGRSEVLIQNICNEVWKSNEE